MLTHGGLVANMLQARAWSQRHPRRRQRNRGDGAAHVSRLLIDHQLPAVHQAGWLESADYESQGHAGVREGTEEDALDRDHRREHPLQRPAEHAGVRDARFQPVEVCAGRRRGGASHGRRTLAGSHWPDHCAGLRADRNLALRFLQPDGRGISAVPSDCRCHPPKSPSWTTKAAKCRSAPRARSASRARK